MFPYQDSGVNSVNVTVTVAPPRNDGSWSRIIVPVAALCSVSPVSRCQAGGGGPCLLSVSCHTLDSVHTPPQECDAGLVVTLLLPNQASGPNPDQNQKGEMEFPRVVWIKDCSSDSCCPRLIVIISSFELDSEVRLLLRRS